MTVTLLARANFDAGDVGISTKDGVWPFKSPVPRTKDTLIVRAQKPIQAGQHGPFKETDNPNEGMIGFV